MSLFAQLPTFLEPTGGKGQGAPPSGLQTFSKSPFFNILPHLHPYFVPMFPSQLFLGSVSLENKVLSKMLLG